MPTQPYHVVIDLAMVDPQLRAVMELQQGKKTRVCGTTTITGRYQDSGGLIFWANQEGLAGRPTTGPESASEQACEIGTLAHAMVESDIRGTNPPSLEEFTHKWLKVLDNAEPGVDHNLHVREMIEKARLSFSAYQRWKMQTKLVPFHTEIALTSKRWLFGGTLDAVQIEGQIALLDWKTSNGIYMNHLVQVGGGYAILWEENFPDRPIKGGFHILRFSKTEGDLTHHTWMNLDLAKEAFKHFRIMYEIDKQLKGRL